MKKIIIILITFVLTVSPNYSNASLLIKDGSKCKKIGQTYKNYKCKKINNKLIWKKNIKEKTNTVSASIQFTDICNPDPLIPKEWADVQEWERTKGSVCPTFYRYVNGNTIAIPKTNLNFKNVNIDQCKLSNNSQRPSGFPRHWSLMDWTKSATIQVIPVQFNDYKNNNDPNKDYKKYFEYISDFLINSSDVKINPEIRMPDKYFELPKKIDEYQLEGFSGNLFISDILQVSDKEINFLGIDFIVVVIPPSVPLNKYFSGGLPWGQVNTQEGQVKGIWVAGPIANDNRINDSYSTSTSPWIWIHELVGHTAGLNDAHEGESGYGMGGWGNMTGMKGDFVIWDKWLMGFVSDDQIACADTNNMYINWIRPNTTKSNTTKAIVIPFSRTKALFIESQRSTGYNYKLPKSCNGVLVYTVDSSATENQKASTLHNLKEPKRSFQCNATLKQDQELKINNYLIKVLESTDFGDVVQVIKI